MIILSWNIQAGLGADGRRDIHRIASVLRDFGPSDLLCLQEVSRDPLVSGPEDQVAALCKAFPTYHAAFGPAYDLAGPSPKARRQFGNLILSRRPLLRILRHLLPVPAQAAQKPRPRAALEVIVSLGEGSLRVITTHLAAHEGLQRRAQVKCLSCLLDDALGQAEQVSSDLAVQVDEALPCPTRSLLCGDFNFLPQSEDYHALEAAWPGLRSRLQDAWPLCHSAKSHAPSCGCHDRVQWPQGPHCRDFFFVSEGLAPFVTDVAVEVDTTASDHQPLKLVLSEG